MTDNDVSAILAKLTAVELRLAVVESKLSDLPTSDHETRLRRVERWQWASMGFAAAAGAGLAKLIGAA